MLTTPTPTMTIMDRGVTGNSTTYSCAKKIRTAVLGTMTWMLYNNHCGMYLLLSDDKHLKVQDSSKKCTGNLRQIQSEVKCSLRQNSVQEFFPTVRKKNFSDWILSRTVFILDFICLGLNFVSDYIPQLYFVCNPLFYIFEQNQLNLSSSQLNLVFQLWHVTWQRDVIFRKDSQGCAPRIWNSDHLCHICSTSPNDHIAVYTYRNERKQPYTRSKLISEHFNQINLAWV